MNWREPYRTTDASGSPEAAFPVAWAWIEGLAEKGKAVSRDPASLSIETSKRAGECDFVALYDGPKLLALATLFRDPMNFTVLVRWMDDYFERLVDDRPKCGCGAEKIALVNKGGACGMGGCPYGGDF